MPSPPDLSPQNSSSATRQKSRSLNSASWRRWSVLASRQTLPASFRFWRGRTELGSTPRSCAQTVASPSSQSALWTPFPPIATKENCHEKRHHHHWSLKRFRLPYLTCSCPGGSHSLRGYERNYRSQRPAG